MRPLSDQCPPLQLSGSAETPTGHLQGVTVDQIYSDFTQVFSIGGHSDAMKTKCLYNGQFFRHLQEPSKSHICKSHTAGLMESLFSTVTKVPASKDFILLPFDFGGPVNHNTSIEESATGQEEHNSINYWTRNWQVGSEDAKSCMISTLFLALKLELDLAVNFALILAVDLAVPFAVKLAGELAYWGWKTRSPA